MTKKISECSEYFKKLVATGWKVIEILNTTAILQSPENPSIFKRISLINDISTYVCNDVDAQGYFGTAGDGQFDNDIDEFTSTDYNNIDGDDDLYVQDFASSDNYPYHHFDFTIDEAIGDITQIDITWKGMGWAAPQTGENTYGHSLWVKESGIWIEKDSGTSSSKETLTAQKTSNFPDWVSSGHLHCAAQADYRTYFPGWVAQIRSYYVEVVVTYTAHAGFPPGLPLNAMTKILELV